MASDSTETSFGAIREVALTFDAFGFRSEPCIRPRCRGAHGVCYRLHGKGSTRVVYSCQAHIEYAVTCAVADAK